MNYRYRVDDADIVLSPEENDKVKAAIKAGGSLVYLRGDSLAINANFIRYIKETDHLTLPQEEERDARLRIGNRENGQPTEEDRMRRKKLNEEFLNNFAEKTRMAK